MYVDSTHIIFKYTNFYTLTLNSSQVLMPLPKLRDIYSISMVLKSGQRKIGMSVTTADLKVHWP